MIAIHLIAAELVIIPCRIKFFLQFRETAYRKESCIYKRGFAKGQWFDGDGILGVPPVRADLPEENPEARIRRRSVRAGINSFGSTEIFKCRF